MVIASDGVWGPVTDGEVERPRRHQGPHRPCASSPASCGRVVRQDSEELAKEKLLR